MSYIKLKGRCYDVIVLNVNAPTEIKMMIQGIAFMWNWSS
jgi:hypothetical protein